MSLLNGLNQYISKIPDELIIEKGDIVSVSIKKKVKVKSKLNTRRGIGGVRFVGGYHEMVEKNII